jgi:hypothetical protein
LKSFNPHEIDVEFLPYLARINGLSLAASMQCCSGHVEYKPIVAATAEHPGRWGYLQLLLDLDLAEWLEEIIRDCDWLLLERSQTWDEQAAIAPGVTENESYVLTFAWDASQWPRPAEEICRFIEEYHHDNRIGQGEDDAAPRPRRLFPSTTTASSSRGTDIRPQPDQTWPEACWRERHKEFPVA